MSPRHDKNPLDPLLRFPRFKSTDLHMSQKQVWNEVVFPALEAAFDRLQCRTEVMVRDEVARELAIDYDEVSTREEADRLRDGTVILIAKTGEGAVKHGNQMWDFSGVAGSQVPTDEEIPFAVLYEPRS